MLVRLISISSVFVYEEVLNLTQNHATCYNFGQMSNAVLTKSQIDLVVAAGDEVSDRFQGQC